MVILGLLDIRQGHASLLLTVCFPFASRAEVLGRLPCGQGRDDQPVHEFGGRDAIPSVYGSHFQRYNHRGKYLRIFKVYYISFPHQIIIGNLKSLICLEWMAINKQRRKRRKRGEMNIKPK